MPEPSPASVAPRRRGRLLRSGAALVVLLGVAAYLTVQYLTGGSGVPKCTVVSAAGDGTSYEFTAEQAVNAATISAVGVHRGMPERAVTIALATALQESALRNLGHGDRDSLGLFQQRPSQGWGTEQEILDPAYAAGEFYEHLDKVPDYGRLPLTVAAQRVQRSGYPEAYAKHEPDATLLAAALTGRAAATLTCEGRPDTRPGGPESVRTALVRDFGRGVFEEAGATVAATSSADPSTGSSADPSAGSSAGSSLAPSGPSVPSASVSGSGGKRTVTLPVPKTAATGGGQRQRGWALAHWAVANSSALHVERVSYAGRVWTAGSTRSEWREDGRVGRNAVGEVRIVTGQ
ncbi:heavy metal transporter [Streptomyces sp. BH-SS-21]|uniref:Heavy metal transporter n=1 Tax=Streptomyces liliiviolaceus TaxID=2823109 RepID=A0A940XPU6_9ACTN|nr:heavy metal transporter [Streptomyces liliiviolaceus]MBQ0846678.1 heavy metal transporter [Streptomyces liliiviolaceus]